MLSLDHIAVSGETLEDATAHVEDALGVALQQGGQHAVFYTHNTLLGLNDGLYLEAISIAPNTPDPGRARWFDIDTFQGAPRLTNWVCRCEDLDAVPLTGIGTPVDLTRGDLTWRMAVPADGRLPFDNVHPAVMQWKTGTHPASRLTQSGCTLTRLVISHPKSAELTQRLSAHFTDARVVFEPGDAAISAEFDTPHGRRVLT